MAQLQVGDIVFHLATIRTNEYTVEPAVDPSGRHWECSKITIDIVGIVNEISIASNKPQPAEFGIDNKGDRLPNTIYALQDYLLQPRRPVTFTVGGVTILDTPGKLIDGSRLSCDARGGPFPQRASYSQFSGDTSAVLSYRVVCYDSHCSHALLSNTWAMTCSIDNHGLTTRTVRGRAVFRKDYLVEDDVRPDDFRKWLLVPPAEEMRRVGVHVEESPSGDELTYTVTDREIVIGLGQNSDVLEVIGSVTSVVQYPVRDLKGIGSEMGIAFKSLFTFNMSGLLGQLWHVGVPININTGYARAIGKKRCDRANLAKVATGFLLDRFSPVLGTKDNPTGAIMMAACTHNIDTDNNPFAEVKIEVAGFSSDIIGAVFGIEPARLINTSNLVRLQGQGDNAGPLLSSRTTPPQLPSSAGTRGTWVGRMATQALSEPGCSIPSDPPAYETAKDTDSTY